MAGVLVVFATAMVGWITGVVRLVALLPGVPSGWSPITAAWFVRVPDVPAVTATAMATVAVAPFARVAGGGVSWHVTTCPMAEQVPLDGLALTSERPAGRVSVRTTPLAAAVPLFLTLRV